MPRLGSVSRRANEVKLDSSFSGLRDYWEMGRLKSHLVNIGPGVSQTFSFLFFLEGGWRLIVVYAFFF